jgi:hypothetical protein
LLDLLIFVVFLTIDVKNVRFIVVLMATMQAIFPFVYGQRLKQNVPLLHNRLRLFQYQVWQMLISDRGIQKAFATEIGCNISSD